MHSILSLLSIAAFHSLVAGYQIPTFLTARQQEGRFLHITDIHLDTYGFDIWVAITCIFIYLPSLYVEGADLEAGCHVKKSRSALDAPVSGKYGSPMSGCDAPLTLVNLTFTTLAKDFASSLDFVIWTGDSVRHDSDPKIPRTMDEVQALNTQVTSMMRETFPKIPILPSIGRMLVLYDLKLATSSLMHSQETTTCIHIMNSRFTPTSQSTRC